MSIFRKIKCLPESHIKVFCTFDVQFFFSKTNNCGHLKFTPYVFISLIPILDNIMLFSFELIPTDTYNFNLLVFFSIRKIPKEKLRKNGNFYAKSIFQKIEFGFWCNLKTNDRRYMRFSLVVYI